LNLEKINLILLYNFYRYWRKKYNSLLCKPHRFGDCLIFWRINLCILSSSRKSITDNSLSSQRRQDWLYRNIVCLCIDWHIFQYSDLICTLCCISGSRMRCCKTRSLHKHNLSIYYHKLTNIMLFYMNTRMF